jgi:tetratricopeptide (TPR) repeat protein
LKAKEHFDSALALEEKERYEEARAQYGRSLELMPHAVAYFRRAICSTELGDYQSAIADTTSSLDGGYRTDGAYFLRANAYIELGRFSEAVADLNEAMSLDPNQTGYCLYRATCLLALGRYPEALQDYTLLIAREPCARYYNARGMSYMALNQWEAAQHDFTSAFELDRSSISALLNRASANQQLQRPAEALADLSLAMEMDPRNDRAFIARGNLQLHMGQVAAAVEDYTHAIEINPTAAGSYQNRGAARMLIAGYGNGAEPLEATKAELALADFDKAITLNPGYADAYAARARLHNALKQFDLAVRDSARAIELDSKNAIAFAQRAVAFRNLGREKEADGDLAQARNLGWSE